MDGKNGFFAGAGANWRFGMDGRDSVGSEFGNVSGDSFGFQARIGYHPGVRIYVPPPPPPPPPPPAPPPRQPDHVLGVKASCEPCTVEVGRQSTVTAVALELDRLHGDLQLGGADRHVDEPHRAEHAVDGAEHRRHRFR